MVVDPSGAGLVADGGEARWDREIRNRVDAGQDAHARTLGGGDGRTLVRDHQHFPTGDPPDGPRPVR
jgi:hypothetical protein